MCAIKHVPAQCIGEKLKGVVVGPILSNGANFWNDFRDRPVARARNLLRRFLRADSSFQGNLSKGQGDKTLENKNPQ